MILKNPKAFRNYAYSKVTGRAKYSDDIKFPCMLYAVPVYSDFVYDEIKSIETADAENFPGVIKVITFKDVPGENKFGQIKKDFQIFAEDKIFYSGDVIAYVVAKTRGTALEGAKRIKLNATELEPLLDAEKAMEPGATVLHTENGTNIINHHKIRRSNIEEGFKDSEIIIEEVFQTQYIEHSYREMAMGQFYGGMVMGIGYVLSEELKINDGKIISDNFNTYRITRATDMPEMKAVIIENSDPNSPSGAKGIREPTNELMAPAIANAVYNVTGIRATCADVWVISKSLIQ